MQNIFTHIHINTAHLYTYTDRQFAVKKNQNENKTAPENITNNQYFDFSVY